MSAKVHASKMRYWLVISCDALEEERCLAVFLGIAKWRETNIFRWRRWTGRIYSTHQSGYIFC